MIDFYGDRKLSFYTTKRESAPLAVAIHRSTPELKPLKSPPPLVAGAPHDLAEKTYVFDVWAVNTTVRDADVHLEIRLFDTETGELREKRRLGRRALPSNRSLELIEDFEVDDKTVVQAIMLDSRGSIIARASDWPQPLKYVHLPPSYDIRLQVLDGRVEITSNFPVKGLELYMASEERKVTWDDNCVDVFPDDTYVINATGVMEGDDVRMRYYGMDWVPNEPDEHVSPKVHINGSSAPLVNGSSKAVLNGSTDDSASAA